MPQERVAKVKEISTLNSYKSAYQDIYSRCCGNRELGILSNNLASGSSGLMTTMTQSSSMNYFLPENNEEILNVLHDGIKLLSLLETTEFDRIDVLLSTILTNQTMELDIIFSILIWEQIKRIVRPDVEQSIFDSFADDELKQQIEDLSQRLMVNVTDNINIGIGSRPLMNGKCTRDCTKCPIAHNFSFNNEDVVNYTRARCPIFLGRQSLLGARVFAQMQVMYRMNTLPFRAATGQSWTTERKMLKPVDFFNERVKYLFDNLDNVYPDIKYEAQASVAYMMSNYQVNMNDIVLSYAKGSVPTFIPE
jgi:hypothetical protein